MKKLLLIIALVPILSFSQSRKQRKAEEKADKTTLANLHAHIQYLADDKLEGRRTGTPGESLAAQYISQQFEKIGLIPKGTNGYIQEFEIKEGKKFSDSDNNFLVNDKKLELRKDYYPLSFSSNGEAAGTSSLNLREKDEPWFLDVKDIVEDNRNDPHFDINDTIIKEAERAKEKGGTALILFNSSALIDN